MVETYTYKSLVQAYLDAHRSWYLHDDFKRYYEQRLNALETAFNIHFDHVPTPEIPLKMLFDAAVRSYWRITIPEFLEAGPLVRRLESHGELGQQVFQVWDEIANHAAHMQDSHLRMLFALFVCIFGNVSTQVNSADLLALGFDESAAPKVSDYDDYR